MKVILIEKQVDLLLKALENYSKNTTDRQLLYATYESLLAQKVDKLTNEKINENVI